MKLSLLQSIPNLLKAYSRPGADPRLKALTASDLERHFFKLKVRATVLKFTGYIYRASEPQIIELFPDIQLGDNIAVVPFHLVHTNQIGRLVHIIGDMVNTMIPRLAIDKAEARTGDGL